MIETAEKQPKPWKPRVQFASFPINPDEFRVAARVVHDPQKGKFGNLLNRIFWDAQDPVLLSGDDLLDKTIATAHRRGRYFMDQGGRKWGVFVYQMDVFCDLPTKGRESLMQRMNQIVEMDEMKEGIHILADTFWPKPPQKS